MGCSYSEIHIAAFIMKSNEFNINDLILPIVTSMGNELAWLAHLFPNFSVGRLVRGDETVKRGKISNE